MAVNKFRQIFLQCLILAIIPRNFVALKNKHKDMERIIGYSVIAILGIVILSLLFKFIAVVFKALIPVVIFLAMIVVAVKYVLKKDDAE